MKDKISGKTAQIRRFESRAIAFVSHVIQRVVVALFQEPIKWLVFDVETRVSVLRADQFHITVFYFKEKEKYTKGLCKHYVRMRLRCAWVTHSVQEMQDTWCINDALASLHNGTFNIHI